ncbi:ketopantoate hydroxymethyltransferase [Paenibacillus barengoltzii]|uniref:ketopantoate hydroxymethyltransferase n=1 Tax=Paenibacillus barengoltzii TaxID=343517 RepID=UPI000FD81216|nr:ketopantoate hydroxymethyltransferase [Paenibacillus barengoltzii]
MIASTLLSEIAELVDSKIAKVVLNETYEIDTFEVKAVTGSTVGMQYVVPASAVSVVTKIELKNSSDQVVSSNDVYVPITSDTLILQTVEVKEAS